MLIKSLDNHRISDSASEAIPETSTTKTFLINYQNVRGLRTKIDNVYSRSGVIDAGMVLFTETWLNDDIANAELFDSSYTVFRSDRKFQMVGRRSGGGVLSAFSEDFDATMMDVTVLSNMVPLVDISIDAIIINGLKYDTNRITGELRKACSLWGNPAQPAGRVNTTARLKELRSALNNATSLKIYSIDAFLVTSDDEHQSAYVAAYDRRREYISGFSGSRGDAIITQDYAVLWTDGRYHFQADDQLNCAWRLMREGEMGIPTKSQWLKKHLKPSSKIGADPRLVPAYEWQTLEEELKEANIKLVEVKVNPIDLIWKDHEEAKLNKSIFVLDIQYAGVSWPEKVQQVRKIMKEEGAEAMVITALDEIAWLFNIRGRDIPYNPVVNSYVILGEKTIHMYVEISKLTPTVVEHLNVNGSTAHSVFVYEYDKIWTELPTMVQNWKKILLPTWCVFSKGVSQKIYNLIPETKRLLMESPIIFLKATKNPVEIENMRRAHIKDAAAMCMFFSYFEQKAKDGHKWTEMEMAKELNDFRFEQIHSLGNSFETIVGYKYNGAQAHYEPTSSTNVEIGHDSTIVIDSGGQYYEGTTDITRTIHYGIPNSDQINAYTRVLIGLIQFSTLTFPASMNTAVADVMARAPLWEAGLDYSHGTSHGVGSFLSVHESPINVHYGYFENSFHLQAGYFLSVEPGYYVENYFGIRLENVIEVISKPWLKHISGDNFLAFQDVTLVPFEPKLINKTLLNSYHILWLNNYNTKIREYVGKELKEQGEVEAFYWMMKMTEHIQGSGNRIPCQLSLLLYSLFFQLIAHVS